MVRGFSIFVFLSFICIGAGLASEPELKRITVDEARARVKLLESVYLSTLQNMHRRYFDGNERAPVPSKVMEEVFRRVDYDNGTKSRWIAVNTPAMHPDHEPKDQLTKAIAKHLKSNLNRFERISDERFISGRSITLFASCQKCHVSALTQQNGGRKVAGLVIELPLVYKVARDR